MKNPLFLMALLAVSACSSPQQVAQRQAQKEADQCAQAGEEPGTSAFDDCRMQMHAAEEKKKADRIAAARDIEALHPGRTGSSLPSGMSIPLP